MLKIRLQRVGRKHEPVFRLVLTDSKNSTKSGKFLEVLGNYDSRKGDEAVLKSEKISYWISKGAQVSNTVHNMLVDKKIISGKKLNALPLKKAIIKEAPATPEVAPAPVEAPVVEEVKEEAPVKNVEEVSAPEASTPSEEVTSEETPA